MGDKPTVGIWRVERVIFVKDGFVVMSVSDSDGNRHSATGEMPTPVEGAWVRMETVPTVHKKYGRQLRVTRYLGLAAPPTEAQEKIARYLEMGFDEASARWLAKKFGPKPERAFGDPVKLLTPGVPRNVLKRVFPGIELLLEALLELTSEGHTGVPLFLLAGNSGLGKKELLEQIEQARKQRLLIAEKERYGLKQPYSIERRIAESLSYRLKPGRGLRLTPPAGHALSGEQARIFRLIREHRVVVLTGGPGSGKTTTIATLLAAPEVRNLRFAIAAPTGKAARRISEVARLPAETLHRLLGLGEANRPLYHSRNPLRLDLLVVDETSMLDIEVAGFLVDALSPSTTVVFVGDPDQLPPVGAGQFLRDLMGKAATLKLTKVFRQAANSPIVQGAYSLREGMMPLADGDRLKMIPLEKDTKRALGLLVEEMKRLENLTGERPQILTPGNTGELGVRRLNPFLQSQFNCDGRPLGAIGWGMEARVGDVAVWSQNDYELGIMNGEVGVVYAGGVTGFVFETPTAKFEIPANKRDRLILAYAMTVHRAQGSEWPAAITLLPRTHKNLLSREMVYTALTRSKEYHTMIFDPEALYQARAATASRRYTWLEVLLSG